MTFPEFDNLFDSLMADCQKMRDTKGKEYALTADRLANFKEIGQSFGISPSIVCAIYLEKHLRSIRSFINHRRAFSDEGIRGRIVDAMTYFALLYALIKEEEEEVLKGQPANIDEAIVKYDNHRKKSL